MLQINHRYQTPFITVLPLDNGRRSARQVRKMHLHQSLAILILRWRQLCHYLPRNETMKTYVSDILTPAEVCHLTESNRN
jgi:hypothetical protein